MSKASKGSTNGNKHPYCRIERYLSGELAFWRTKRYDPPSEDLPISSALWKYNQDAYEAILREEIKHHKNFATLE